MHLLARRAVVAAWCACATLPPRAALSADDAGIGTALRRAVVRGAQLADQADSVWQQVAGEVVPAWQAPTALDARPPPALDGAFAAALLDLPLEVGAQCCGVPVRDLEAMLPTARQEAVLLYGEGAGPAPLNNEPFYGAAGAAASGTAKRGFPRALATAVAEGQPASGSELFNFEVFVRWRVLQRALSDDRAPDERRRLQRCFTERLGDALLSGPLRGAPLPEQPAGRREGTLVAAVAGCGAILSEMQRAGLFQRHTTTLTLGSGTDLFDASDWAAGGSTTWQYVVSGSSIVGASQLAQDRTAATGQGAGLFPGQLLTTALAAYLRRAGIGARVDEYFLDNRVGRPDPRTFSDPAYYSDVLLEIVALEES